MDITSKSSASVGYWISISKYTSRNSPLSENMLYWAPAAPPRENIYGSLLGTWKNISAQGTVHGHFWTPKRGSLNLERTRQIQYKIYINKWQGILIEGWPEYKGDLNTGVTWIQANWIIWNNSIKLFYFLNIVCGLKLWNHVQLRKP